MKISKDIVTKRLQTTMIGALYEFEKNFGYLWGLDDDINDLNIEQKKFRIKWETTRNNILNNGNNQLRKCLSDLDKVSNEVKYNYKFYTKNNRRNDEL